MVIVTKIFSTSQTYRHTEAVNFPGWGWTHPRFPLDGAFITRIYNTGVRGYEEEESNDKKKHISVENKATKIQDPVLAHQNLIKEIKQMTPQDYVYNTVPIHVVDTNNVRNQRRRR